MKHAGTLGVAIALMATVATAGTRDTAYHAPKLIGSAWLNVKPADVERLEDFKGRVTVLHFWTFECINCRHNLPSIAKWAKQFPSDKVQVIGVHTPELPEERVVENVRRALPKLGIEYPVLVDNNETNWSHYGLQVWPTVFLIDKKGRVRRSWVGELNWDGANGYEQMTETIQELMKEPG